jgi:hypothetical protein
VEKLDWDAFQSGPEGILVSVMSGKETYLMGYTPSQTIDSGSCSGRPFDLCCFMCDLGSSSYA